MQIQLIRNATMKITYTGHTFLADPMLASKDEYDPFVGKARNPTIELPIPIEDIIAGIDGIAVTHIHPDHFDKTAGETLPKDIPLFCQPGDEERMTKFGFQQINAIDTSHNWEGITISRTGGFHGSGEILKRTGTVSGFMFQADGQPTVYWVGDTIWCEPVEDAIQKFKPDIIITHSGGAEFPGFGFIIMDGQQTLTLAKAAPDATIVAVHMESLDHCTTTRQALRSMADNENISPTRLMIPADGETITF